MHFEKSDLIANLAALKPIGLSVLLERPCRYPPSVLRCLAPKHLQASLRSYNQCLCALGREIGFTDGALQPFSPTRLIFANFSSSAMGELARSGDGGVAAAPGGLESRYSYTLTTLPGEYGRAPPAMQSLCVQQSPSGALQLVSRGNALSILDHWLAIFCSSLLQFQFFPI